MLAWAQSASPESLFISVITLIEIEKGIQLKTRQDPVAGDILRRWLTQRVLPSFRGRMLPVDEAVALENAGYHVPDPRPLADSLIAATAKVRDLCLVTRNVKDFELFKQAHGCGCSILGSNLDGKPNGRICTATGNKAIIKAIVVNSNEKKSVKTTT